MVHFGGLDAKRQNQKYKLILDNYMEDNEKATQSGLKGFVANHLMLNQL